MGARRDRTRALCAIALPLLILLTAHESLRPVQAAEDGPGNSLAARADSLLGALARSSRQAASHLGDLLASIPFGKIALGGGALLGIFFLFIRLLIVMGPILILGALTRETTDTSDLLKILMEFYNQLIVSLDEQTLATGSATRPHQFAK